MSGYPGQPPINQPGYGAPPTGQPGYPGYGFNPYQPGQPAPGQPHPGALSYPGAPQPSAPVPGYGYPGYPNTTQQPGYPNVTPQQPGYPNVTPQQPGYPNVTPQQPGYPNVTPQQSMYPNIPPSSFTPVVEWLPTNSMAAASLSDRAVVAGYEGHDGSPLWVIRSLYQGDLIPGKLAIKHRSAYVPWGGKENAVQNFEVCCARPEKVRWVECRDGAVPPNAIAAGNTSAGETLFVGRAKYQGSLTPGKVHTTHRVLYISFAGVEVPHKVYEVLCTV